MYLNVRLALIQTSIIIHGPGFARCREVWRALDANGAREKWSHVLDR
jgi:hypothetical protein